MIIRLIANSLEIDPYIIGEHEQIVVKLNSLDDSENLEVALTELVKRGYNYSVNRGTSEKWKDVFCLS